MINLSFAHPIDETITSINQGIQKFNFIDLPLRPESSTYKSVLNYRTDSFREEYVRKLHYFEQNRLNLINKHKEAITYFQSFYKDERDFLFLEFKFRSEKEELDKNEKLNFMSVDYELNAKKQNAEDLAELKSKAKDRNEKKNQFTDLADELDALKASYLSLKKEIETHPSRLLSPSFSIGIGFLQEGEYQKDLNTFFPRHQGYVIDQQPAQALYVEKDRLIETEEESFEKEEFQALRGETASYRVKSSHVYHSLNNYAKRLHENYDFFKNKFNYKYKEYDLASVTKLIVSIAFMKVLENNFPHIELKKPILAIPQIADVFKFPAGAKISLYDLLTHQSGLDTPGYPICQNYNPQKYQGKSLLKKYFEQTVETYNQHETYTRGIHIYRDINIILIGYYLKHLYFLKYKKHFPLETIVEKEIFIPANMNQTGYKRISKVDPLKDPQIVHDPIANFCFDGVSGNAGIFSTNNDLTKFGIQLLKVYNNLENTIGIKKSTLEKILTPSTYKRGLGVDIAAGNPRGDKLIYYSSPPTGGRPDTPERKASMNSFGHTGFTGTSFWIDFDKNIVSVMLSNSMLAFLDDNNQKFRIHEWSPAKETEVNRENKKIFSNSSRMLSRFIFTNY
ncbi:beta-lactamase family protein [Bacteriovoracaceae bacterium]|nr:beta-lactamase family protein [Bacteriovoracaceae bacterium]